ncbi:MAG: hypothetical protein K2X94_01915 [Amoebophilaceae bacterium]|nr:hypothetical protein [Amoebophilaceae bacterium]
MHGLNCYSEHPELVDLADQLQYLSKEALDATCVPMEGAHSIKERGTAARKFIKYMEAKQKHDEIFLVGHSFGGLFAADLGTELKNVKGVVTINSPMGGVSFPSKDNISEKFIAGSLKDLGPDKNALDQDEDSPYLQEIRSAVQQSDLPILSIGSTCRPSKRVKVASYMIPMVDLSGVR